MELETQIRNITEKKFPKITKIRSKGQFRAAKLSHKVYH